jgi:dienelactone hydrolase
MNLRHLTNSRLAALACVLFLVIALSACDSGDRMATRPEPVRDDCDATSYFDNGSCRTFALRIDARAQTRFTENGQGVALEVVLFRPLEDGRYPTLMFNHGSTGNGSDPSLFGVTFTHKALTRFFVERGWMVAFPQRRGRGRSDGLYDEGFRPDRSAYSCDAERALAGAERALEDIDAVTDWLRDRADVDTTRMLIGGVSRGGVLAVTHTARRPDVYLAAINFVGGWIAEGCGDDEVVNRTLFVEGARFPGSSIWLYASADAFYSLAYSRSNFAAFTLAGGLGEFHEFSRAAGRNGHFLINDPALWADALSGYIDGL